MSQQDKKLDNFVQKILELQKAKEKEQEQLSEEDLWEIAQVMGLDAADLQSAKENYLARGQQHLRHGNWDNARREFEQLLFISPNNPKGTLGLAKSEASLWTDKGEESHRIKALALAEKSLQLDPNLSEAYVLIKRLNQKSSYRSSSPLENTIPIPNPKRVRRQVVIVITATLAVLVFSLGLAFFLIRGQMLGVASDAEPEMTLLIPTEQGVVSWIIRKGTKMGSGIKHNYEAQIVNPKSGETLASVPLIQNLDFMKDFQPFRVGNQVLIFNEETMQAELRDPRTGEVKEDLRAQLSAFPELESGIGAIQLNKRPILLFRIVAKNNQIYWYSPFSKKLAASSNQMENPEKVPVYGWTIKAGEYSQSLALVKQMVDPAQLGNAKIRSRGGQEIALSEKAFIKPDILFGNEEICVVLHKSDMNQGADILLSGLNQKGDVIWEKKTDSKIFYQRTLQDKNPRNISSILYENTVVIASEADRSGIMGIDKDTGDILWEYYY